MSRIERAAGAIVGMAAGDALGAPYEFQPPFADDFVPAMTGGGAFAWEVGEWTDDTSMAVPILRAGADGGRLDDTAALDRIVAQWAEWARDAKDVGNQTRSVLTGLRALTAEEALRRSREVYDQTRSDGNGSLMRTAPVALAHLHDEAALVEAARRISELTHFGEDSSDACVIWCVAIRHAVLIGEFDVRRGVDLLPAERRQRWHALLDEAERMQPRDFAKNGWVVEALQAAWCAIHTTPIPDDVPAQHLRLALEAAVRGGRDTDTVAAIAGAPLGAKWGVSAVPADWRRKLHGWPGLRTRDLARLAILAANGGRGDEQGWPSAEQLNSPYTTLVQHPHDDGVWMGGLGTLADLPEHIDAVVSLCRTGSRPTDREHVEMWLVDQPGADRNPNLEFVLTDAADVIHLLRKERKQVYVHCIQGASRPPAVGALYAARHLDVPVDRALLDVTRALPHGMPAPFLQDAVRHIAATGPTASERPDASAS